jgi:hypothetical protein
VARFRVKTEPSKRLLVTLSGTVQPVSSKSFVNAYIRDDRNFVSETLVRTRHFSAIWTTQLVPGPKIGSTAHLEALDADGTVRDCLAVQAAIRDCPRLPHVRARRRDVAGQPRQVLAEVRAAHRPAEQLLQSLRRQRACSALTNGQLNRCQPGSENLSASHQDLEQNWWTSV